MNETKFLYEKLERYFGEKEINAFSIPPIIEKNLNPKLKLIPYQEKAFKYFIKY
jgi:hypothetical protein